MGAIAAALARRGPEPGPRLADAMFEPVPYRGAVHAVRTAGRTLVAAASDADAPDGWVSAPGPLVAALAGRLDNVADLARELRVAGDANPADVVVAAFRAWGAAAPNRFRGTFAGAVGDGERLTCFRDHIGFRTLFYRDDADGFHAGSEAKQVVAGAGIAPEPDMDVLERILYGWLDDDMPTALRGVRRLPKRTTVTADAGGAGRPAAYWHPERLLETARIGPAEAGERFLALLEQAVRRSLTGADVVSLSGGVDSPAVAAFAAPAERELTGTPAAALSAVFPDLPRVDESRYIELVADALSMPLHTYRPQAKALDDVERWTRALDGPVPTVSIPEMHENYELARRLGFRTILTGELAEFVIDRRKHLIGHLLLHGRWHALPHMLRDQWRRLGWSRRPVIAKQLLLPFLPGTAAAAYVRLRDLHPAPAWLDRERVHRDPYRDDLVPRPRDRWLEQQLRAFPGPGISLEGDEMVAAMSGVSVRRPFTDIDLWEFFLSLPAEVKFPDPRSKTFVKRNLRGRVPDAILDRRDKTGFNDHLLSQIDYGTLRRYLVRPRAAVPGVDYRLLGERLEREELELREFTWARDLCRIHAFLERW